MLYLWGEIVYICGIAEILRPQVRKRIGSANCKSAMCHICQRSAYLTNFQYDKYDKYMTLQLLHSEFPYIWGKFDYLFYQCSILYKWWPARTRRRPASSPAQSQPASTQLRIQGPRAHLAKSSIFLLCLNEYVFTKGFLNLAVLF